MNLEEILRDPRFHLPVKNSTGGPYKEFIVRLLQDYIGTLEANPDFLSIYSTIKITESTFLNKVKVAAAEVVKILEHRRDGASDTPALVGNLMLRLIFTMYMPQSYVTQIPENTIFYRCIGSDTEELQSRFFHAPFEIPEKVDDTRFSIPGIPSLYLANSLSGGYLECRAKTMNRFQAAKFENKIPLAMLNLDYHLGDISGVEDELEHQRIGSLYPLFAACFSVYEDDDKNPQEYMVPQLVTNWLREGKIFDGILYSSTKTASLNYKEHFYNLVLPPKVIADSGHCIWLRDTAFNMSDICYWNRHHGDILTFFTTDYPNIGFINKAVETIEWPEGSAAIAYQDTDPGQMEFFMRNHVSMIVKTIKFS
jgi:hypothetical protein